MWPRLEALYRVVAMVKVLYYCDDNCKLKSKQYNDENSKKKYHYAIEIIYLWKKKKDLFFPAKITLVFFTRFLDTLLNSSLSIKSFFSNLS